MTKTIMIHWLTNRARKIEKDNMARNGKSLSFISIERILSDNAIIEIRQDKGTMIINMDKFKKNQKEYLKTVTIK